MKKSFTQVLDHATKLNVPLQVRPLLPARHTDSQEESAPSHDHARRRPTLTPRQITMLNHARQRGDAYFHIGCGIMVNVDDYAEY